MDDRRSNDLNFVSIFVVDLTAVALESSSAFPDVFTW